MTSKRTAPTAVLALTLVFTALNLRASVTSIGALLRDIQADVAMSDTVAGILTTIPALCFGLVGLAAARFARRVGVSTALVGSLVVGLVGIIVRAFAPGVATILIPTLAAVSGFAIVNVLLPVAVKVWFPDRVGVMTGFYSVALVVGSALPAAVSVPLAESFGGWRAGIGLWAVPVAITLIPWFALRGRTGLTRAELGTLPGPGTVGERPVATEVAMRVRRNAQAWGLTLFFGFQSFEAYVVMGWLPTIYRDLGLAAGHAGVLTSVVMLISAPIALIVPVLAARSNDQRGWVLVIIVASMLAYIGMLAAPLAAPVLWAVLLGIGLGAFPFALLLLGLRARTSDGTSALSSMVQGFGYLIASLGPVTIGFVHDVTGGWTVPLWFLFALMVPKLIGGLVAARPGYVDDPVTTGDDPLPTP